MITGATNRCHPGARSDLATQHICSTRTGTWLLTRPVHCRPLSTKAAQLLALLNRVSNGRCLVDPVYVTWMVIITVCPSMLSDWWVMMPM